MATLIFDIKTVLNEEVQQSVAVDEVYTPYAAKIKSLALYDYERAQGALYVATEEPLPLEFGGCVVKRASEADIVRDFWEGASGYDTLVSYNGRTFDLPFIAVRSAAHSVTASTELLTHRYLLKQGIPRHVDLMDQLTFYGVVRKAPSLAQTAKVFKTLEPLPHDSAQIAMLSVEDLLAIHSSELMATRALYEHWLNYLAPAAFINSIDLQ